MPVTRPRHTTLIKICVTPLWLGLGGGWLGAAAPSFDSPPLPHATSWLGNTYPGAQKWVQQDIHAMTVTADGSVFTNVEWDEGGGNAGEYRDGELIRYARHTHGWGAGGGVSVAVNSKFEGSQGHSSCEPMGFDVAGDFLFVPYTGASKRDQVKHGRVEVFRTSDGSSVGHLEPSAAVAEIGLQDIRECLTAHRRANGEFIVLLEDDYKSKVVMYRWQPDRLK